MSTIPHELSDYILDFLHSDRKSLKACSLTCRSWYPTARYHLYCKVYLRSELACRTYLHLLEGAAYLGQFAHYLNISKAIPAISKDIPHEDTRATSWSTLFTSMPNVEMLELSFLEMDNSFHTNLLQNFARTSQLTLQYCRFPTFGDLAAVLLSLPCLRQCTLRSISWETNQTVFTSTATVTERRSAPAGIKALILGRDLDLQVLVEWLLQEHLCGELESVSACCAYEGDVVMLSELLRASAATLKHADLDWYCSSYRGVSPSTAAICPQMTHDPGLDLDVRLPFEFTLAACSSLQTLSLHCPIALHSTVPWVDALLADVNPAQLESITFEIRLLGSMYALDWSHVEELLLQESFKKLQTVSVKVAVWHTATERTLNIEAFMRAHLSKLHSRGMLKFLH
jgi:hypothetical protein